MIVVMHFSRQPKARRLQRELEKTKRDLQQYTKHTTTGSNETTVQPMTDKPDRPTDVTNEPERPTEVTNELDRPTNVTNELHFLRHFFKKAYNDIVTRMNVDVYSV